MWFLSSGVQKHYRCIRRGWVLLAESQRLLTERTKLGSQNKAARRLHPSPLFFWSYLKSHMHQRNGGKTETRSTPLGIENQYVCDKLHSAPRVSLCLLGTVFRCQPVTHCTKGKGWIVNKNVLQKWAKSLIQICLPPSCTCYISSQVPHTRSGVMITKQSITARRRLQTDRWLYVTHTNDLTVQLFGGVLSVE